MLVEPEQHVLPGVPEELQGPNLKWMCVTVLTDYATLPPDKVQRWLGFVQAGVVLHGRTTVQAERDFTRPLMHARYKAEGRPVPITRQMRTDHAE